TRTRCRDMGSLQNLPKFQTPAAYTARRSFAGGIFLLRCRIADRFPEDCMPADTGSRGTGGASTDADRRGGPRIPIEMWVEETTDSERYFRRAGNLSRGGLRLDHTIPLPLGTVVNLTFTLPGDSAPVQVHGEIVSTAGPDELRM